jgi:hypothetical protein
MYILDIIIVVSKFLRIWVLLLILNQRIRVVSLLTRWSVYVNNIISLLRLLILMVKINIYILILLMKRTLLLSVLWINTIIYSKHFHWLRNNSEMLKINRRGLERLNWNNNNKNVLYWFSMTLRLYLILSVIIWHRPFHCLSLLFHYLTICQKSPPIILMSI